MFLQFQLAELFVFFQHDDLSSFFSFWYFASSSAIFRETPELYTLSR